MSDIYYSSFTLQLAVCYSVTDIRARLRFCPGGKVEERKGISMSRPPRCIRMRRWALMENRYGDERPSPRSRRKRNLHIDARRVCEIDLACGRILILFPVSSLTRAAQKTPALSVKARCLEKGLILPSLPLPLLLPTSHPLSIRLHLWMLSAVISAKIPASLLNLFNECRFFFSLFFFSSSREQFGKQRSEHFVKQFRTTGPSRNLSP